MAAKIKKDNERIFVIGDLNIDLVFQNVQIGNNKPVKTEKIVGGTGVNASLAFKKNNFIPITFGKVGNDYYGRLILDKLNSENITSIIEIDENKPTCICNIIYFKDRKHLRTIFYDYNNANDYDIDNLKKALDLVNLNKNDFIFLTLYIVPQVKLDLKYCCNFFNILKGTNAKIIIDLVPHDIYNYSTFSDLNFIFNYPVFAIVGEYKTFKKLMNPSCRIKKTDTPDESDLFAISKYFKSKYYICRYGEGNISFQSVFYISSSKKISFIEKEIDTGYSSIAQFNNRGFGDILTSKTLKKILNNKNKFL